jgi:hypothetical protein
MNRQHFDGLVRSLVVDPSVAWTSIEGRADHPEAKSFKGSIGHWQFLVMGAPADEAGRMPICGTALNLKNGKAFVLPLDLAKLAFDQALLSR